MDYVFSLLAFCQCTAAILTEVVPPERSLPPQPNIILILADDLGFNDVSFHGSSQIPTPNIDQLANEGIIFKRFYVGPQCTISRSALMTGRYPFTMGMQGSAITDGEPRGLPLDKKILPQFMQEMGYSTHMIGKWHLGQHKSLYFPHNRGFDTFLGTPGGEIDYFTYQDKQGYTLYNKSALLQPENKIYITDLFTSYTEEIISSYSQSPPSTRKPFFLYFAPNAPHTSNNLPTSSILQAPPYYVNRPEVQSITNQKRQTYAGMVIGLDEAVGRVRQAVLREQLQNNTIIWFLSDNGGPIVTGDEQNPGDGPDFRAAPANNWPLRGGKRDLWEGGVRVPAIVWGPQALLDTTKRTSSQLFHITDFIPTLVALAGGDPQTIMPMLDGINQWEAIRSGSHMSQRTLLPLELNNKNGRASLIWKQYKIVRGKNLLNNWYRPLGTSKENPLRLKTFASVECNYPEGQELTPCNPAVSVCLFNIVEDPCEINNIAADKPYIVKVMVNALGRFNQSYVPPNNLPVDPRSLPSLHRGVWVPWLDDIK